MTKFILPVLLLLASCVPVNHLSDTIEEPHYALYKQKVLLVYTVGRRKVTFTNPTHTRYYYLMGKHYTEKWAPGDTFIIIKNLEEFYDLKFVKEGD